MSQGKCIQLVGVGFQVVKKPNARFGNTESRVAMRLEFLVNRSQLGFELVDFHLRVGHFLLLGLEV